jgi:hypothetical protein
MRRAPIAISPPPHDATTSTAASANVTESTDRSRRWGAAPMTLVVFVAYLLLIWVLPMHVHYGLGLSTVIVVS